MTESEKAFTNLADSLDDYREMMRALVNGLVSDGFTPEQARWCVVGALTSHLKGEGQS